MQDTARRPLLNAFEVRAPRLAAGGARLLTRLPPQLRRRVLSSAFDRAADAFNRGDLESVFALFAEDVEYVPPPALYTGEPLHGRAAVFGLWREVFVRFDRNEITNLSIAEAGRSRFVRSALLSHRGAGSPLEYVIRQTTEMRGGLVVRQINEQT
jgi:ketosteroid isomerase-like protein